MNKEYVSKWRIIFYCFAITFCDFYFMRQEHSSHTCVKNRFGTKKQEYYFVQKIHFLVKVFFFVKVNIFCLKTEILKHEVLGYVPA